MTGTSQATAFVTGAAALVMSHKNQYFKAEEIKKYILSTGDTATSLIAKTKTSRQLNLFKALTILSGEKAFSGADKSDVQDGFYSDAKQNKQNNDDPNLKTTKNVAKFGKSLLEAVSLAPGIKKPAATRLGQDQKDSSQ